MPLHDDFTAPPGMSSIQLDGTRGASTTKVRSGAGSSSAWVAMKSATNAGTPATERLALARSIRVWHCTPTLSLQLNVVEKGYAMLPHASCSSARPDTP